VLSPTSSPQRAPLGMRFQCCIAEGCAQRFTTTREIPMAQIIDSVGLPRARSARWTPSTSLRASVVLAASFVITLLSAERPAAAENPLTGSVYVLRSGGNHTCLTAVGGALEDRPCAAGDAQRFILHLHEGNGSYTIQSKSELKCVEVPESRPDNALPMRLNACLGAASQQWKPAGATMTSIATGKCLAVGAAPGQPTHQYACDGGPRQVWALEKQP